MKDEFVERAVVLVPWKIKKVTAYPVRLSDCHWCFRVVDTALPCVLYGRDTHGEVKAHPCCKSYSIVWHVY